MGGHRLGCAIGVCLFGVSGCGAGEPDHEFPAGGYRHLSEAALYRDIAGKELAPDLFQFAASHALWSDGAEKARYLRLPPGAQIDTSSMDHWQLPVGAQLFKSFTRDGILIETRLIERIAATGDRDEDYWAGAFLWRDDESDADFVPDGAADARGTEHDVPDARSCWLCHRGQPGAVLGLSAIQLSAEGERSSLTELASAELLSHPPSGPFSPPGEGPVPEALGYLHANCSPCHNPRGSARIDTDMDLELSVADQTPDETRAHATTVGVALQYWTADDLVYRVVAGAPDESGLLQRMSIRGTTSAMPPVASELVHAEGMAIIRAWIEGM